MKRTVKFEGTINGKTYNSVQEYNDAMMALVGTGAVINAQSRTYTDTEADSEDLYPGLMDMNSLDELDEIVGKMLLSGKDPKKVFTEPMEDLFNNVSEDARKQFINAVNDLLTKTTELRKDYSGQRTNIERTKEEITNKIIELEDQKNTLESKADFLIRKENALMTLRQAYAHRLAMAQKMQPNANAGGAAVNMTEKTCDCQNGCGCKPQRTPVTDFLAAIDEVAKQIFGE